MQRPSRVSTFNMDNSREGLVKYIADCELPISIGVHPSHMEYMKLHEPNYRAVSRHTTRRDIIKYYNKRKAALTIEIKNGSFCVALTSDIWHGKASDDYITVVAHFIDTNWFLHKKVIGFPRVDRHNSETILNRIMAV